MYVGDCGTLEGEKFFRNGAQGVGMRFPGRLFTNHSAISNSRQHTVPSAYLHLITDKEKGFRTAVCGTPVELILHLSVHKVV